MVVEVDIDVEGGLESPVTLRIPVSSKRPVSVLVVSSTDELASWLTTALGSERVRVRTVREEPELRRAVFSDSPLLVLIDTKAPADIERGTLAAAVRDLPDSVTPVIWAVDDDFGRTLAQNLRAVAVFVVELQRSEGEEPLLDLVRSRHSAD